MSESEQLSDDFKATFCGAEYHNIDGTGWPDAVVMENQGSVLDGTYESRMYYPERTCRYESTNRCTWACTSCGREIDVLHRGYNYCPNCGAKVVEE